MVSFTKSYTDSQSNSYDLTFISNAQPLAQITSINTTKILLEITLPGTVDYNGATYTVSNIQDNVFSSTFKPQNLLSTIIIPNTISSIGNNAFSGQNSLTSCIFDKNSTLVAIGDNAFYSCTALTTITIPSSLMTIGLYTFAFYFNEPTNSLNYSSLVVKYYKQTGVTP